VDTAIAAAVAVATRLGLAKQRDLISIIFQLGATPAFIAIHLASRAAVVIAVGGATGGFLALSLIVVLPAIATSHDGTRVVIAPETLSLLPKPLWALPLIIAVEAVVVGFITTQITVRGWLRHLP
jgi:cell division transport system permease protein